MLSLHERSINKYYAHSVCLQWPRLANIFNYHLIYHRSAAFTESTQYNAHDSFFPTVFHYRHRRVCRAGLWHILNRDANIIKSNWLEENSSFASDVSKNGPNHKRSALVTGLQTFHSLCFSLCLHAISIKKNHTAKQTLRLTRRFKKRKIYQNDDNKLWCLCANLLLFSAQSVNLISLH